MKTLYDKKQEAKRYKRLEREALYKLYRDSATFEEFNIEASVKYGYVSKWYDEFNLHYKYSNILKWFRVGKPIWMLFMVMTVFTVSCFLFSNHVCKDPMTCPFKHGVFSFLGIIFIGPVSIYWFIMMFFLKKKLSAFFYLEHDPNNVGLDY